MFFLERWAWCQPLLKSITNILHYEYALMEDWVKFLITWLWKPSVFQTKHCWKILVNEARIYCIKPLRFEESNFTVRIWSIRSTEKYAYNMYVITVNLRKFQFLWIKTSLFVSAQRHDLSSYARLWRMNRQKNRLRRLENYVL